MLKPFLLVFDLAQGSRQEVLDFLDMRPEVKNWYAFLPTAIFVTSDRTANELASLFRQRFSNRFFVISEVPERKNDGWLYKEAWDFINSPRSSGRWP